ncbi:MAG: DUF2971 domain-containing protein [Paludibacter sp.]|nr:DUF2971 domain-containing protein [Paludibacter sp.]
MDKKVLELIKSAKNLEAFSELEYINYTERNRDCLHVNGQAIIKDILTNKSKFKAIYDKLLDSESFNPKKDYFPKDSYFVKTDVYYTIEDVINEIINENNLIKFLTGAKSLGKTLSQNVVLKEYDPKLEANKIFWVRCDCEKLVETLKKNGYRHLGQLDDFEAYLNIQFLQIFSMYYRYTDIDENLYYFYKRDFFREAFEMIKNSKVSYLVSKDFATQKSYEKRTVEAVIDEYNKEIWHFKKIRRNNKFHYGREIILTGGWASFEKWNAISSEIQLLLKNKGYRFLKIIDGLDNYKKYNKNGEYSETYNRVLNSLSSFCDSYINSDRTEYESIVVTLRRNTYCDFIPVFKEVKRMDTIPHINMRKDSVSEKKKILDKRKDVLKKIDINNEFYRMYELICDNFNNNEFVWNFLDADKHVGYYIKNTINLLSALAFFKDKYKLDDDEKFIRFMNEYQPANFLLNGRFGLDSYIEENDYSIDEGKMLFNIFYYDFGCCHSKKWHGLCATRILQHLIIQGNLQKETLIKEIIEIFDYEKSEVIKQISKLLDFSLVRLNEYAIDGDEKDNPYISITAKGISGLFLVYSNADILYHCALNSYLPKQLIEKSFISAHDNKKEGRNFAINCLKSVITFINFLKIIDIGERQKIKDKVANQEKYTIPLHYDNIINQLYARLSFLLPSLKENLHAFKQFMAEFKTLGPEMNCYNKIIKNTQEDCNVYIDMAILALEEGKYKEAASNFSKAKYDILSILAQFEDEGIMHVISYMVETDSFFTDITKNLSEKEKKLCKDIYIKSLNIIKLLHVTHQEENQISHYTTEKVAETLLLETRSNFRLYSVIHGNDREEGIKMLKYLDIKDPEKIFANENYRAFIGCFTYYNKIHNQFRLYGKKDGKEVTGVSIMLKNDFFSKAIKKSTESYDINSPDKLPLYRCIYISDKNRIVSISYRDEKTFDNDDECQAYKSYIDAILSKIKAEMADLKTIIRESELESNLLCKLLLNLRYLVKSAKYQEEQECRIMCIENLTSKKIHTDSTEEGIKLYVRYFNMQNYANEICIALNNYQGFRDNLINRSLSQIQVSHYEHFQV